MMKHLMTYAAAMAIGTAATCYGSTVPFEEDFEGFGDGAEISGTSGWLTTDVETGAGVTGRALGSTVANDGSIRGGSVTNADLSNTFTPGNTFIFGSFYVRPYFGPAPEIPADVSVAFYVSDDGTVVAYSNEVPVTLSHTPIASNTYVKFAVSVNYNGSKAYSLYLDDALIASDFAFFAPDSNSSFNAFQVRADSGTNIAYIDDVNFGISSPFFQIVSNPVAGAQVTLFVGDASPGATYKVVGRDDAASVFVEVATAVNSGGVNPFPITDSSFVGSSADTRVYKIVDATGLSESTNDTMWIADKQARGSNQWHMVAVPGHFGDTNLNTLNNDLGAELAKFVDGGAGSLTAGNVWLYEGAAWLNYWLDVGGVWHGPGALATVASNRVDPGQGVWVKTIPQGSGTAILSGQAHTNSTPISMTASNWVLFAWPFATPEANSANGWGFSGFTAGTSWDNASRIFMQDGNTFYNLYLSADGKWKIQNTTNTAPVSLRPGQAYYFYNAGGTEDYTAAPAN
ncbi:MAG: hypothetical protein O2901_13830 [Verrucomicrobia bacterium]|nr:hypothetical protein [Verrucomicrobiota bacterium]